MKIQIDFSEVTEISKEYNDGFYIDVLTNSHIKSLNKLDKVIDLYFLKSFYW